MVSRSERVIAVASWAVILRNISARGAESTNSAELSGSCPTRFRVAPATPDSHPPAATIAASPRAGKRARLGRFGIVGSSDSRGLGGAVGALGAIPGGCEDPRTHKATTAPTMDNPADVARSSPKLTPTAVNATPKARTTIGFQFCMPGIVARPTVVK